MEREDFALKLCVVDVLSDDRQSWTADNVCANHNRQADAERVAALLLVEFLVAIRCRMVVAMVLVGVCRGMVILMLADVDVGPAAMHRCGSRGYGIACQ